MFPVLASFSGDDVLCQDDSWQHRVQLKTSGACAPTSVHREHRDGTEVTVTGQIMD